MKFGKFWSAAGNRVIVLAISALLIGSAMIACSGSGGSSGSGFGTATVSISDPATCAGPSGPFAHVYVTITDVQANTSAGAGDNDAGWKDLTPSLSSQPRQIDLLGQANNQCFLATLGDAQQLQAGSYQQIRLILADNSVQVKNNLCGSSSNCVVLTSDGSVHPLLLSSESKTGLKIPSGQIAGGEFNIATGQTKDLNIDFDTCASIVQEGNGQYRLKPVLHAGEVSTTSTSINGKILDHATGNPIDGKVLVALEQKDPSGIDRIVMSTLAGPDGAFVFCPIPSGSYDLVIVAVNAGGTAYNPAVVTGVANGNTVGTVNLFASAAGIQGAAQFTGRVTSQNASNAATAADIELSALESVGSGATYTIPLVPNALQPSATLTVETAASSTCSPGTDCADYSLQLPAGGPYIGSYSTTGATLAQSSPLATYVIDGLAFVPASGAADCTPPEQKTPPYILASAFNIAVQPLAFVQCQ